MSEYHNETSQRERREALRNDTYLSRAQGNADSPVGGRYAKELATQVVGVPRYPMLPSTSPWSHDATGDEPSLGYSIDEAPVVGEPHELGGSAAVSASEGPLLPSPSIDRADPPIRRRLFVKQRSEPDERDA